MVKKHKPSSSGPPGKRATPHGASARSSRQQKTGLPVWLYVAFVAGVVVLIGGGVMMALGQGGSGPTATNDATTDSGAGSGDVQLPRYAYADSVALVGYKWATTQAGQDVMKWMPCYCGCGQHGGHKDNLNCFIQDPVAGQPLVFDSHGST